jgi:hypothetical protein
MVVIPLKNIHWAFRRIAGQGEKYLHLNIDIFYKPTGTLETEKWQTSHSVGECTGSVPFEV